MTVAGRALRRAASFASVTLATSLALAACFETKRGLGEECIKDDDCLSGICRSQLCASAPPLYDGSLPEKDAGNTVDAGTDAPADAGEDGAAADAPAG